MMPTGRRPGEYVRQGSILLLMAACRLGCTETPDAATQVLEELRAAQSARSAQARELQEWRQEQERMAVLHDTVAAEIAALEAAARQDAGQTAALRRELEACAAERRALEATRAALGVQAQAITAALAESARRAVPGAVTIPAGNVDPTVAFDEAVRCLDSTERAAAAIAVELVEGRLAGQPRAVKLLRVGGLGWWADLDGNQAGVAVPSGTGEPPVLEPCADAARGEDIRRAIAMVEGRRVPELLRLPMPSAVAAVLARGAGKP
jgi:hypothetical protein